jgi:hypothetical protein
MDRLRRHGAVVAREYASIKQTELADKSTNDKKWGTDFMAFAPDIG